MSVSTRSPLRVAGATTNSGAINTGEQLFTQGGTIAMSVYSGNAVLSGALSAAYSALGNATGTGYDVLFYSGAGRLKDVVVHQGLTSGQAIVFYDAGAVSSGGPFPSSGTKILAVVPTSPPTGASGTFVAAGSYPFDVPFQSGLCVALKSGQAGFSVTFIPETNPAIG